MNKTDAATQAANLSQNLEAFLNHNGFCFSRKTIERLHRDIFNIVCDTQEKGLIEQRITAYVHDKLILFEAAVPVTSTDNNAVAALVNTLNIAHPAGTFQFDIRDGELNWTHFLSACHGKWPGNENVMLVMNSAREMAGILYRELLSTNASPAIPEQ